jgi:hypothetical protein
MKFVIIQLRFLMTFKISLDIPKAYNFQLILSENFVKRFSRKYIYIYIYIFLLISNINKKLFFSYLLNNLWIWFIIWIKFINYSMKLKNNFLLILKNKIKKYYTNTIISFPVKKKTTISLKLSRISQPSKVQKPFCRHFSFH